LYQKAIDWLVKFPVYGNSLTSIEYCKSRIRFIDSWLERTEPHKNPWKFLFGR
jgi:hypothetical protein